MIHPVHFSAVPLEATEPRSSLPRGTAFSASAAAAILSSTFAQEFARLRAPADRDALAAGAAGRDPAPLRKIGAASLVLMALLTGAARAESSVVNVPAQARLALGSAGVVDARIDVAPHTTLRVTASGAISIATSLECGSAVGPRGCAIDRANAARPIPFAPSGALLGTFVDLLGRPATSAFMIGEAATIVSPPARTRLVLSVNLPAGAPAGGAFGANVSTADVSAAPAGSTRTLAQHALRRLGFAASPEYTNQVASMGVGTWLSAQLRPRNVDDSVALAALEPAPTQLDQHGDLTDQTAYSRRLLQRQFATLRQVQEKLVMHWIDHFAVGNGKIANEALMAHYEETLRADALGNFKTLLADVSKEPAMLYWLDNDNNDGSNPSQNPPNENFARELMQLYVLGTTALNLDGTPKTSGGAPQSTYTQADVRAVAQALSGFAVNYTCGPASNPNTCFSVSFYPEMHTPGPKAILGTTMSDPSSAAVVDGVIDILARNPSTAPFQAKELIQRFVSENPSPQYVAAVAAKWAQTVDAPDQIAQVIRAMFDHPEFAQSYHSMIKEPVELEVDALRQLPGVLKRGSSGGVTLGPGFDFFDGAAYLIQLQQAPYYAPSVFSFYRPGQKNRLMTDQSMLARFNVADSILATDPADPQATIAIDTTALRARIGSNDPSKITSYLLDAMLDGGTPAMRASLETYLANGTDDLHLRGALWLIMTSPDYEVN